MFCILRVLVTVMPGGGRVVAGVLIGRTILDTIRLTTDYWLHGDKPSNRHGRICHKWWGAKVIGVKLTETGWFYYIYESIIKNYILFYQKNEPEFFKSD